MLLPLCALLVNFRHADLSDDWRTYDRAAQLLDGMDPGAQVLAGSWFEIAPIEYLRVVERRRPDVAVINMQATPLAELYALVDARQDTPVYSTNAPGWLASRYTLEYTEKCDCYRIR